MQPVPPGERIAVIDALRGVALIGIIVANMRGFNSAVEVYYRPDLVWNSAADLLTQAAIDVFVTGKFIAIFAVLFGLGFAVQLTRAAGRGQPFTATYVRRMIVLLGFGAAHAFLLWWGDILLSYAAMGLVLLLIRKHVEETLLNWSLYLYCLPLFFFLGFAALNLMAGGGTAPSPPSHEAIARAVHIYAHGGLREIFAQRLADWQAFNSASLFTLPRILGLFLFGYWLWRTRLFQDPAPVLPQLRRWLPWMLLTGLTASVVYVAIFNLWSGDAMAPTLPNVVMWVASSIGTPALSLFYGSSVILAFQGATGRRLLMPFTYVGRMALTNYILQSAICTWIFYSWGWGWFGRVSPLAGLGLSIAIYSLQVVLSVVWLRWFRYGPLEWLWRSLTYLHPQPLFREGR